MERKFQFSFEKLDVYQKAISFGELVNVQVAQFPRMELFNLSSQF